MILKPTLLSKK